MYVYYIYSFYYILQAKLTFRLHRALVVTHSCEIIHFINKYYAVACFYLPRKISAFSSKPISPSPVITMYSSRSIQTGQV